MRDKLFFWAKSGTGAVVFAFKTPGSLYERVDAAVRYVQYQGVKSELEGLDEDERAELRRAWLETPGTPRPVYKRCASCSTQFDPNFKPATGYAPSATLCGACVQTEAEAPPDHGITAHDLLESAARYAHKAGWDLAKFQDESAAYYLGASKGTAS